VFVAFDLLHRDGADLRAEPLIRRRELLEDMVGGLDGPIQFSAHVQGNGPAFYERVDKMGLEGMVSKRGDSIYLGRGKPSRSWLKTKCFEISEFEVAGVQVERGKPPQALMVTRDGERRYVGSAFIGLSQAMRERLWSRVQRKKVEPPKGARTARSAEWLKPGLIGKVRHLKGEEKLRHATLVAIAET
jgi:bifunctional non-homologous end joining protein LigD